MGPDRIRSEAERRPLAALAQAVSDRYGLSLKECTPESMERRLRFRLADRALDGVESYAEYLLHGGDATAWEQLLETLTENESRIFGDPDDFTPIFELESDPRWSRYARPGSKAERFRCLSAACGTGEEAYSLAIALAEVATRTPAFSYEVIGVDVSARALARARRAVYPASRAASLPADLAEHYLEPVDERISTRSLRAHVRFARVNLCEPGALSLLGEFDLVFARDLLPVLTSEGRRAALANLAKVLRPGGVLVLGAGDSPGDSDLGIFPIRWGERHAYERPLAIPDSPPAADAGEFEPVTALVAHRSALSRSWMRILLEQRGYRVEEAQDGLRALECAVVRRPCSRYFLELTLPVHGGPMVAERLTRLCGVPADAVVYLSPRGPAGPEPAILPAGARIVPLPLTALDLDQALTNPTL